MRFDPHDYPYPSGQHLTYGHRGMVATSQPLAAWASTNATAWSHSVDILPPGLSLGVIRR
jgi:hypothetical protein